MGDSHSAQGRAIAVGGDRTEGYEFAIIGVVIVALLWLVPTQGPKFMHAIGRLRGDYVKGQREAAKELSEDQHDPGGG